MYLSIISCIAGRLLAFTPSLFKPIIPPTFTPFLSSSLPTVTGLIVVIAVSIPIAFRIPLKKFLPNNRPPSAPEPPGLPERLKSSSLKIRKFTRLFLTLPYLGSLKEFWFRGTPEDSANNCCLLLKSTASLKNLGSVISLNL